MFNVDTKCRHLNETLESKRWCTGSELAVREGVFAVLVCEGAVVPLVRDSGRHHLLVDEVALLAAVPQDQSVKLGITLKIFSGH